MYKVNLKTYWLDFVLSSLIFLLCFAHTNLITFIIGVIFLYRAGAFTHEIAHQNNNPKIKTFKTVWNWTVGLLILQPSERFTIPHLKHHSTGIFGTENDPQYPLIRSNFKLAITILFILPLFLPIYNLVTCFLTALEVPKTKWHDILYKDVYFPDKEMIEIVSYERLYAIVFILMLISFPGILIKLYLFEIGAWFLSVLRIPLEHDLSAHRKTSTYEDQKLDSFTHESFLYIPVQPLALRYHTAHHMYPKVPYHNLKKKHCKLRNKITLD